MSASAPVAVILAAGAGTRLGHGPKALLGWGTGTLASRAAGAARAAGCRVVLTVPPAARRAIARDVLAVAPGAQLVPVPSTDTGMSVSLRAGVDALSEVPPATPVVVLLVDQPGVGSPVLRRLLAAHTRGGVTRAQWAGAPGHPIVFSLHLLRTAAADADGDAGARGWLRRNAHLVTAIECGDLGRGDDVDTAEDATTWPRLRLPERPGQRPRARVTASGSAASSASTSAVVDVRPRVMRST